MFSGFAAEKLQKNHGTGSITLLLLQNGVTSKNIYIAYQNGSLVKVIMKSCLHIFSLFREKKSEPLLASDILE